MLENSLEKRGNYEKTTFRNRRSIMICPKCQSANDEQSRFCIKCGTPLQQPVSETMEIPNPPVNDAIAMPQQNTGYVSPTIVTTNIENQTTSSSGDQTMSSNRVEDETSTKFSLIKYLILFLTKPITAFNKDKKHFSDPKNALVLSGVVSVFTMLAYFLRTFILLVFSKGYKGEIEIDFDRLEYLKISDMIFKNLFIIMAIIVVVAFVYYVVGLILKKTPNFLKLLVATASSLLPFTILVILLSTVFSYIWEPLAVVTTVVGVVASLIIFLNLIDHEFAFEGNDQKVYFHLLCLSIILIVGYFVAMRLIFGNVSGDLGDLLDMFS